MQEMTQAEKKERVEKVLRSMNWAGIHEERLFGDFGQSVVLYDDGEYVLKDSNEYFTERDPEAAKEIGSLSCWGGDVDKSDYFEGFVTAAADSEHVEEDEDDLTLRLKANGEEVSYDAYIEDDTGRVLTKEAAFREAIEHGDWGGYEHEIEEVMRRYDEDVAQAQ